MQQESSRAWIAGAQEILIRSLYLVDAHHHHGWLAAACARACSLWDIISSDTATVRFISSCSPTLSLFLLLLLLLLLGWTTSCARTTRKLCATPASTSSPSASSAPAASSCVRPAPPHCSLLSDVQGIYRHPYAQVVMLGFVCFMCAHHRAHRSQRRAPVQGSRAVQRAQRPRWRRAARLAHERQRKHRRLLGCVWTIHSWTRAHAVLCSLCVLCVLRRVGRITGRMHGLTGVGRSTISSAAASRSLWAASATRSTSPRTCARVLQLVSLVLTPAQGV